MKSLVVLVILFFVWGCSSTSYSQKKEKVIAAELCLCVEEYLSPFSIHALETLEYAFIHQDMDYDAHVDSMQTVLDKEEMWHFLRSIDRIQELDDNDFDICGEDLLERYPKLEDMPNDDVLDLFLENLDPVNCRATLAFIKLRAL